MAKTAALLQITAIVLIQFYSIAPLFSRHFIAYAHVMRCTGNHAKCGCSPERIASHTCCCCQSKRLGFPIPPPDDSDSGSGEAKPAEHMTLAQGDTESSKHNCCKNSTHKEHQTYDESKHFELEPLKKTSCCNKSPGKEEKFGKDEHSRLIPCISSVPCGGDPAFISVSLEKPKFLRPTIQHFQPAVFSAEYPFLPRTAYQGRFLEPPDPPPKLSILS